MTCDIPLQQEKRFYDQRWANPETSAVERERIGLTVEAIPKDARRVLDVWCGDGRITLEIQKQLDCFAAGIDLSPVALSHGGGPRCCGSADNLPFADSSFDLVLSTEILEHIPELLYTKVLGELRRVSGRYILITVPSSENLEEVTARCGSCGARFHVWGHMRFYTEQTMEGLFPGFRVVRMLTFGGSTPLYNSFLLWVRHTIAGAWYWEENTVCHSCGSKERWQPRWPFLARVCDALNARLWGRFFQRHGWLLALYERVR